MGRIKDKKRKKKNKGLEMLTPEVLIADVQS